MESSNKIPKGQLDIDHKLDKDISYYTIKNDSIKKSHQVGRIFSLS